MQVSFAQLLQDAKHWAAGAVAEGWLAPADIKTLEELDNQTPASLFEAGTHRPLVAAFFGGTGVGKSTLLNRLAGQTVARTGVERPTSREVSVYLHESVQLVHLPREFPVERVRAAYHRNDDRRQVLWIDMPDIDSIEQHNRELVLEWLPHIDVLIYVVSPERYRDDKGWRLLQTCGGEHAWLFVMNQWDRGHPAQYDDFAKLLARGGFRDPIILRTDSREGAAVRNADDFGSLQSILREMADRHLIRQLEIHAEGTRLRTLHGALATCLEKLGDERADSGLEDDWMATWEDLRNDLLQGLEWPIQRVARAFVGHEANPLRRSIDLAGTTTAETRKDIAQPRSVLWDEWAESRFRDGLDRLVVDAGNRGIPAIPVKGEMDRRFEEGGRLVLQEGQRSLRQALANPGNAWQRAMLRLSGVLTVVLPLITIGWASYQVVTGYYQSALHHSAYLGVDFAIHSVLLISLSWLLPFFVYRKLRPSAERTAIKGLRQGIAAALDTVGQQVAGTLQQLEQRRGAVAAEGRRISELAASHTAPEAYQSQGLLERVLPLARGNSDPLRIGESTHSMRSK